MIGHDLYLELGDKPRAAIDAAVAAVQAALTERGFSAAEDDLAERLTGAIAEYLVDSSPLERE